VAPASDPDRKLTATVEKVSTVPVTPGNFEARITLAASKDADGLMPGMACTVKAVPYVKEEVVAVPSFAVFADELDEDKHFVYLAGKADKPEKRAVTVGKKGGGKTEIVDGLKEGDEIVVGSYKTLRTLKDAAKVKVDARKERR
jgi:multidrug efflux pump subunit AcrA (membrane-fusion protein)